MYIVIWNQSISLSYPEVFPLWQTLCFILYIFTVKIFQCTTKELYSVVICYYYWLWVSTQSVLFHCVCCSPWLFNIVLLYFELTHCIVYHSNRLQLWYIMLFYTYLIWSNMIYIKIFLLLKYHNYYFISTVQLSTYREKPHCSFVY